MSVKLLLKANANFGNFCFNHDLNKETIIYNCTGNKDKIFIDNNSFHSRNCLSNVPDTQSFMVRACFPSSVHVADRGGKSFLTSRAIYRVYQYSVYICQGAEREDFLPIMSKITHWKLLLKAWMTVETVELMNRADPFIHESTQEKILNSTSLQHFEK